MTTKHALTLVALVGTAAWLSAATPAPAPPFDDAAYAMPQAQEQSLSVMMIGKGQAGPHLAVPPFVVLTADQATQDASRTLTTVLNADLKFEREFDVGAEREFLGVARRVLVVEVEACFAHRDHVR